MSGIAVDRDGTFRAEITGFGLKEMESGAVSVAIAARLTGWFGAETGNEPQWYDFSMMNMEADGDFWIVGSREKGSKVNEHAARSLIQFAGWDGMFDSIQNQTWEPTPCQVVIKSEEYRGTKRRKIAFLNDYNRTPGANLSNVTPEKVKELSTRFGSQFRAIAGSIKRNGTMPSGAPSAPPMPMAPPPLGTDAGQDIPFAWLAPFILAAISSGFFV